ncbi:MAG: urease subunit alpha [Actinomycetes bacterium]|jgi:urease subunit alpha
MTLNPLAHADVYGPRTGDRVNLGDTGLVVQIEAHSQPDDDEFLLGFGKTGRDGIGLRAVTTAESCDVVITNVLVIDPILGIRTASIGIRDGRIMGVGRAGNPDTTDSIDVVLGTGTVVINGEGLIATAGAVDTHVHLLSPRVMEAALASGVTTVIGQEFGPFWGVGVNAPGPLRSAYAAFDAYPINVGLLGRGSVSRRGSMIEGLEAGVCGFKVHEDTGAHLRSLDTCLTVADEYDVQVAVHTDGLNEGLSVGDTLAVADGRVFHAFHVEGCGGGHTPDVLRLAGVPNVIASSTNPTLPFGRDAVAEHFSMIMWVHALKADLPGDEQIVRARVRAATMAAESVLHDRGVIPITSSDAQGMGRAGETVRRTFQLASVLKPADDDSPHDNDRVLRYLAKLTINPAIAHGLSHEVGSLQPGRMADIVLWSPATFGAKPYLVLKSGLPAWGTVGDPNSVVDVAEPRQIAAQFGGIGGAAVDLAVLFTNKVAVDSGSDVFPTRRRRVAVTACREIGLADMVRHRGSASVAVDPAGGRVTLDGTEVTMEPVQRVPLSRLYFL